MKRIVAVAIAGMLLAVGCTSDPSGLDSRRVTGALPTPAPTPVPTDEPRVQAASTSLVRFEDCDELTSHLRTEGRELVGAYGLGVSGFGGGPVRMDGAEATTAGRASSADAAAAPQASTAEESFSGTNVQEAGVDEPDIVKTDGRRILAVAQGRLHVVVAEDGRPRVAGSLELPEGWGHELLLDGDRVLVLARGSWEVVPLAEGRIAPQAPRSTVLVVDVSDPAAPQVVSEASLEGEYVSARMVDGIARLVVRSQAGGSLPFETPHGPADQAAATVRNRDIVSSAPIGEWMPSYVMERGGETSTGPLATCTTTYRPEEFSGLGMVTVVTMDPDDPEPRSSASVLADAQTVYASTGSLYVATNRWTPRPMPVEPGGDVAVAPGADVAIAPVPGAGETEIHRFDISDPRGAEYVASGTVEGHVLNQWSLSEHERHLRVATTVEGPTSESRVVVLETEELTEVGSIGGLGETERIYAVRFMGDRGYVVTFRQVDPLYALDLSDPTSPTLLGELKIPGYSAYLHPVSDGYLLGIGQDATDEGRTLGTQVSLFDVRDPRNPRQVDKVRIDGAHSEVEGDHHAFTWWAPRFLAMVPIQAYAGEPFSGAVGYVVRPGDGIEEVGRVTHEGQPSGASDPSGPEMDRAFPGGPNIRRSIVVSDVLYTLSEAGIMASDLGSLDEVGWAAF